MKVKSSVSNEDNSVNNQNGGTIESCPDEPEIPYSQIPNELARSREISPECGHLIINLLTNKPGWRINVSQIVNRYHGFWGRDKVYRLMKEAINAGFIKKTETRSGNRFGQLKYIVARTPKFKKEVTVTGFQEAERQDSENKHFKKNDIQRIRYDDSIIKKNDNVSVHNSSATPPELGTPSSKATPYRSSHTRNSIVSPPSATFVPFDPATFNPKTYRMPNGSLLTPKCANSFARYNEEQKIKLYANLSYFEEMCKKDPDKGEAYLQSCINHNYAEKQMDLFRNRMYAEFVIQDNKLTQFEVMKTVVKHKGKAGESIKFDVPYELFVDRFHDLIGIGR